MRARTTKPKRRGSAVSACIISFAVAIWNFLLPLTLDSIHNRVLEFLDPENMGVAVGILFLSAIEAEIYCEHFVYESGYTLLVWRSPS